MGRRLWVLLGLIGIGTGCTGLKGESSSSGKDGSVPDDASMIIKPVMPSGTAGSSGAGAGGSGGSIAQPTVDAGPDAMSEPPPQDCQQPTTYYADSDRDDHGDPAATMEACAQPDGYVANQDDCDDACATCFPGNLEQCDNHDNDCDGNTDGQQEVCGSVQGICTQGMRVCTAGEWGVCEGAVLPAANEACEGSNDENCNGTIDEGCSCTSGMTRSCGEDRGLCAFGTQDCSGGSWSASCTGGTGPASESCNGMDDDCNGANDDPFTNLGDACSAGAGACKRDGTYRCNGTGSATVCGATAGTGSAEVCANSVDDDCDSKTDEAPSSSTCCIDAHCASTHKCNASRQCVPKTWCEQRARPSGVTASDYQCLDFDTSSSLPGTPWSAVSTGEGMPLAVTNGEAQSSPNSLYSYNGFNFSDARYIRWSAVAGTTARTVTFAADFRPRVTVGFANWAESEPCICENTVSEVFCITAGTRKHCLGYNFGEHIQSYGMVLISREDNTVAELFCDINATPQEAVWSRIELTLSTTAAPVVKVNGTTRNTSGCTMTLSSAATSVLSGVGFANDFEGEGWSAHIDNVEISIRR